MTFVNINITIKYKQLLLLLMEILQEREITQGIYLELVKISINNKELYQVRSSVYNNKKFYKTLGEALNYYNSI